MSDLHTKYRPTKLEAVLGQSHIVKSLSDVLTKGSCHAFVFTGTSGAGKTTLARIVALAAGCTSNNLLEVDAATHSGVDDMRAVTEGLRYAGMGKSPVRAIIVDEAHRLSAAAWASLLKQIEEPSKHVYWMLCTTEALKIPETIKNRCVCYEVRPVKSDVIYDLLRDVAKAEKLETSEDVLYLIAEKAHGSVRRALTNLSQCAGCKDRKEAARLIKTSAEDGEIIDLCRALAKGGLNWEGAMAMVKPLQEQNGESIRMVVLAYFTKVLMGQTDDKKVCKILNVLGAFADPYPPSAGISPVLLSLGRVIYAA